MKIHGHFIAAIFSLLAVNASYAQEGQAQNQTQKPEATIVDSNGSLKIQSQSEADAKAKAQAQAQAQTRQASPRPQGGIRPLNMPGNTSNTMNPPNLGGSQSQTPSAAQPLPPGQNPSNPVYPNGVNNPGGPR